MLAKLSFANFISNFLLFAVSERLWSECESKFGASSVFNTKLDEFSTTRRSYVPDSTELIEFEKVLRANDSFLLDIVYPITGRALKIYVKTTKMSV